MTPPGTRPTAAATAKAMPTAGAQAPASNPSGPAAGGERVIRGGSWLDDPAAASAWMRRHADPLNPVADVGFRCAD